MFRTLIIGAGAMGSLFSGLLHRNGFNVTLFNRPNLHTEVIQTSGLTLIDRDQREENYKIPVVTQVEDLVEDYDLVIVLLKSFATEEVLGRLKNKIKEDTVILSLQNGVGNKEVIQRIFPNHIILIGGTGYGATKLGEGVIAQRAFGTTFIGSTDNNEEVGKITRQLSESFNQGEIITEVSENVDSVIWSKLIVNVAYNALTAITRLKNGGPIQVNEGRMIIEKLVNEAVQVANLKNIPLFYNNPYEECIKLGEEKIGKNTSSMLTDILYKRKTEIDAINGAIVKSGQLLGIETPYNELITNLIKVMEQSYSNSVEVVS